MTFGGNGEGDRLKPVPLDPISFEVIRNALLMAGIDSNWQGAFVGAFIILAVLIGMETRGFSLKDLIRHMFQPGPGR